MRLDEYDYGMYLVLSRRNVETLLAKLDGHPPDSACTIVGPEIYGRFAVTAEETGEMRYLEDDYGMHFFVQRDVLRELNGLIAMESRMVGEGFVVVAEDDLIHYNHESRMVDGHYVPPGGMHPDTERALDE